MDKIVVQNRNGVVGGLDERDYYKFIDLSMRLNRALVDISNFIKTKNEINDTKNPIRFYDEQLDALDDFVNAFIIEDLMFIYFRVKGMNVPCEWDRLTVTQALEYIAIQNGEIIVTGEETLVSMIEKHTEKWLRFNSNELLNLKIRFEYILSNWNYYILSTFFKNFDDESETIYIDKSLNDWLIKNNTTFEKMLKELDEIYTKYTPKVDVLTKNPEKAIKFFACVEESDISNKIYDYKELLTEEDLDAVIQGKIITNDDFIFMLEQREQER